MSFSIQLFSREKFSALQLLPAVASRIHHFGKSCFHVSFFLRRQDGSIRVQGVSQLKSRRRTTPPHPRTP